MKPEISATGFGSITIEGTTYRHDIVIQLNGEVKKRKKKLSRAIFGTSHILSLDEAEQVYEKSAGRLIIGAGQYGLLKLSKQARDFFAKEKCTVSLAPTPEAIKTWNEDEEKTIGLFHVTC